MVAVYNDRTANQLADDAAEAIRGLNHLTRDDASLRYPSEVYAALGSLSQMLTMLPQALHQMDALIERWVAAGHVSIDSSEHVGHPEAAGAATSVYLEEAQGATEQARAALGQAQAALTGASWKGPARP